MHRMGNVPYKRQAFYLVVQPDIFVYFALYRDYSPLADLGCAQDARISNLLR